MSEEPVSGCSQIESCAELVQLSIQEAGGDGGADIRRDNPHLRAGRRGTPLLSPTEGLGTRWSHWLGIGAIGLVD